MRFAIAYYKKDLAGLNIINQLKKLAFAPQFPIIELKKDSIFSEDLNEKNYTQLKNIDFIIFATKHKSEKEFPSLTIHAPGNWRSADFGGQIGKICKTSALILKYLFQNLNKLAEQSKLASASSKKNENSNLDKNYNITLEATHHGPLINYPCLFIEIGSSEKQWNDENAGRIIAKTILSLQNFNPVNKKYLPAIGIGGPH
jgi:D-aminoacyl-tRNA deacylase